MAGDSIDFETIEYNDKCLRLARYFPCHSCKCQGYKRFTDSITNGLPQQNLSEICSCGHQAANHLRNILNLPTEKLNWLHQLSVDADTCYRRVLAESNPVAKKVYFSFLNMFKRCIANDQVPDLCHIQEDISLGKLPFENPTIELAMEKFCLQESTRKASETKENMVKNMGQMFLRCLDCWQLSPPEDESPPNRMVGRKKSFSSRRRLKRKPSLSQPSYHLMFVRWMCYCYLPKLCKTLAQYRLSQVFGRKLLQLVLEEETMKSQLMDRFVVEAECLKTSQRKNFLKYLPRFLVGFQSEVGRCWSKCFQPDEAPSGAVAPECCAQVPECCAQVPKCCHEQAGPPTARPSRTELADELKASGGENRADGAVEETLARWKRKRRPTTGEPVSSVAGDVPLKVTKAGLELVTGARWSNNDCLDKDNLLDSVMQPRDRLARSEEDSKIIHFEVMSMPLARAVGSRSGRFLLETKTLFAHHLPRMPRSYIAKLVLDPKHKCLCLVRNEHVIGAVCFRMFADRGFSEIVFCAVSSSEQVKGYGAYMMNYLKDYHVRNGVYHFLTFADEAAVGYFLKMGFSKEITLPAVNYTGYIKEYEGAFFMGCQLNPKLQYRNFSLVCDLQKRILAELSKYRRAELKEKVHAGLQCFKDGVRQIPIECIPGMAAAGWKADMEPLANEPPVDESVLYQKLKQLVQQIKVHSCAGPFLKPVDKADAPDYYEIVRFPIDLKMISDRVRNRYYCDARLFVADCRRMFDNCRQYNSAQSDYVLLANRLEQYILSRLSELGLFSLESR